MKKVFRMLIVLWIIIAFFNVLYNVNKTISESREWLPLSDSQKRHKIFGDLHDFLTLLGNNTNKNDHILIFSKDGEKYQTLFLSLYYLYPRIITTTTDKKEFKQLTASKKFQYVAAYDSPIYSDDYEKVASFSSKMTTNYGSLFILK